MVPPNYVKIFVSETSADIKKTGTLGSTVQKIHFGGSIWGFSGRIVPSNCILKLCQNICLLNIFQYQKNWHPSLSRS